MAPHARAKPLGCGVPVLDVKLIVARFLYVVDLTVFDSRVGVQERVLDTDVSLSCSDSISRPISWNDQLTGSIMHTVLEHKAKDRVP